MKAVQIIIIEESEETRREDTISNLEKACAGAIAVRLINWLMDIAGLREEVTREGLLEKRLKERRDKRRGCKRRGY